VTWHPREIRGSRSLEVLGHQIIAPNQTCSLSPPARAALRAAASATNRADADLHERSGSSEAAVVSVLDPIGGPPQTSALRIERCLFRLRAAVRTPSRNRPRKWGAAVYDEAVVSLTPAELKAARRQPNLQKASAATSSSPRFHDTSLNGSN